MEVIGTIELLLAVCPILNCCILFAKTIDGPNQHDANAFGISSKEDIAKYNFLPSCEVQIWYDIFTSSDSVLL